MECGGAPARSVALTSTREPGRCRRSCWQGGRLSKAAAAAHGARAQRCEWRQHGAAAAASSDAVQWERC